MDKIYPSFHSFVHERNHNLGTDAEEKIYNLMMPHWERLRKKEKEFKESSFCAA